MELLNHTQFKHSLRIDKCCLMEYSITKEKNCIMECLTEWMNLRAPQALINLALWSSSKGNYSKSSTPFSKYCTMEHSIHLHKKNNMELIDYNQSKHSIIIDKYCLMECSIIKRRKLHYGGLNKVDDFKNSIGFDKSCLMEYSMPREKKVLYGVLQKFDIWRTPYPK